MTIWIALRILNRWFYCFINWFHIYHFYVLTLTLVPFVSCKFWGCGWWFGLCLCFCGVVPGTWVFYFFSLWCLYFCGGCLGYLDVTYKLEMMTKYILEVLFLLFFLLKPLWMFRSLECPHTLGPRNLHRSPLGRKKQVWNLSLMMLEFPTASWSQQLFLLLDNKHAENTSVPIIIYVYAEITKHGQGNWSILTEVRKCWCNTWDIDQGTWQAWHEPGVPRQLHVTSLHLPVLPVLWDLRLLSAAEKAGVKVDTVEDSTVSWHQARHLRKTAEQELGLLTFAEKLNLLSLAENVWSSAHVPSPRPHVPGATSDLIWWKPSLQREVLTNGSTPFLMLAGDVGTQIVSSSFLVGNGVQIIDFHLSKDGVVLMYALAGSGVLGFLAVSAASLSDGSFLQYFIAGGFFVSEALVE